MRSWGSRQPCLRESYQILRARYPTLTMAIHSASNGPLLLERDADAHVPPKYLFSEFRVGGGQYFPNLENG